MEADPPVAAPPRRTTPELVGLLLGPAFFAVLAFGPTLPDLVGAPQRALGILAWCATWWLTTPVALPVTSLLGLALLPLLGVLDKTRAMELFGNQSVFFVVAAFIVAAVAVRTGLSTRVALWALKRAGRSEDRLAGGTLLVAAGLTSVIISHAVAALLLPIVIEIIRASNLGPGSRFARRLLLSMAWGTICGSNLSMLSSARASLATGMYAAWMDEHGGGTAIGFVEFSAATLVPTLLALVLAYVALRWFHPPEGVSLAAAVARLADRARSLGRVSSDERVTALVILGMVLALVGWGREYGLGTLALLAAAALFVSRAASWEDAEERVNWGVALLYGGAIAVAAAIEETHALEVLVDTFLPVHAVPVWALVGLCAALTVVITAFVSNAAAIALLLPLCLTIAEQTGINPRAMAILLPVAAGLDFSLPVSTPAMAMVFGTGYLRTQDSVFPGVIVSIVGTTLTVLVAALLWPLLGLPVVHG
jgi:sodium-dependent dicarboxylate transporter 2/3/5